MKPMTKLFGIKNCDKVKQARRWLEAQERNYQYYDFRDERLSSQTLERWCVHLGWQQLLNQRSRTWRQLSAMETTELDEARALELMLEHPTLIKRPVIENEDQVCVGFDADKYQQFFDDGDH